MPLKIEANQSAIAYHIIDGATRFPYAIDAQQAIGTHPGEWSADPWPPEAEAAARKEAGAPEIEPTPEEKAAIDAHAEAVAEATERLAKFRADQADKAKVAAQATADEALVASPPPRPDPAARRPTLPQIRAKAAALTPEEQKMVDDKKAADEQAAAPHAPITG